CRPRGTITSPGRKQAWLVGIARRQAISASDSWSLRCRYRTKYSVTAMTIPRWTAGDCQCATFWATPSGDGLTFISPDTFQRVRACSQSSRHRRRGAQSLGQKREAVARVGTWPGKERVQRRVDPDRIVQARVRAGGVKPGADHQFG